jgi:hypothetical protein
MTSFLFQVSYNIFFCWLFRQERNSCIFLFNFSLFLSTEYVCVLYVCYMLKNESNLTKYIYINA